jgi:hypothetical protein
VQLDDMARVPDLVQLLSAEGVRLTRVEPHSPTLEDLYFAVRGRKRPEGGVVPRDPTPLEDVRLSSGNRLGRGFRDPFKAAPGGQR